MVVGRNELRRRVYAKVILPNNVIDFAQIRRAERIEHVVKIGISRNNIDLTAGTQYAGRLRDPGAAERVVAAPIDFDISVDDKALVAIGMAVQPVTFNTVRRIGDDQIDARIGQVIERAANAILIVKDPICDHEVAYAEPGTVSRTAKIFGVGVVREESHESRTLQRLFEITQDIRQAEDIGPALDSIARGLSELYGWKYVSIVASDAPGGEMYRRVIIGFPPEAVRERLGEHIPREAVLELLKPEYEVVPHCFYIPAEREQVWQYNIYIRDGVGVRARSHRGSWHEHDSLTMVLADRGGEMLGYISVDGPLDGRVPSQETLREM